MEEMVSIIPGEVSTSQLHRYLLGAVAPRPIAFASTLDASGRSNLAPFSFYNVFSAHPPILIFSPARRVRDRTTKHTLDNIMKTKEVVVNAVDYTIVQQMSLTSAEYAEGENEFIKAGLTMLESHMVKPHRVAESPVQFECIVNKIEPLGDEGGAGNLIFCQVLKIHINASILDENENIDPFKIDQVARMGGGWYTRAVKGLFEIPKPNGIPGIGVDQIPEHIRLSKILTGNDLGKLGTVPQIPSHLEVSTFKKGNTALQSILETQDQDKLHMLAQGYLDNDDILSAWKILLAL